MRQSFPVILAKYLLILLLGTTVGWYYRDGRETEAAPAYGGSVTGNPEQDRLRNVRIDRPDPTSPTGRRAARLIVRRVTGGPEGTVEWGTIAVRRNIGGEDLLITDRDWTVTIGPRTYLMTVRND